MAETVVHNWDYAVDPATDPWANNPWGYWNTPSAQGWKSGGWYEVAMSPSLTSILFPWKGPASDPGAVLQFENSVVISSTLQISADPSNRKGAGIFCGFSANNYGGIRFTHIDNKWELAAYNSASNGNVTSVDVAAAVYDGTTVFGNVVPTLNVNEKRNVKVYIDTYAFETVRMIEKVTAYIDGMKVLEVVRPQMQVLNQRGWYPGLFVYGSTVRFYDLGYSSYPASTPVMDSGLVVGDVYIRGEPYVKFNEANLISSPIVTSDVTKQGYNRHTQVYFKYGQVRGSVKVKNKPYNIPVRRWVYLHDYWTKACIDRVMSNVDGTFTFEEVSAAPEKRYYVTSYDDETGFQAVINDNVRVVVYPHDKRALIAEISFARPEFVATETDFIQLTAKGADSPTWKLSSGSLPPGWSLNERTGAIGGKSTAAATQHTFTISCLDSTGATASCQFSARFGKLTSLLHFDVATQLTDSASSKVWKPTGSPSINISPIRFGTGAVYFNGVGSFLTTPQTDDLKLGNEDFTIDMWVNPSRTITAGQYEGLFSQRNNSGDFSYSLLLNGDIGGAVQFLGTDSAGGSINAKAGVPTRTAFNHIAVVRRGPMLRVYLNGVGGAPVNIGNASFADKTMAHAIGLMSLSASTAGEFLGYIDELRVVKGAALWYDDFTPPTLPSDGGL